MGNNQDNANQTNQATPMGGVPSSTGTTVSTPLSQAPVGQAPTDLPGSGITEVVGAPVEPVVEAPVVPTPVETTVAAPVAGVPTPTGVDTTGGTGTV